MNIAPFAPGATISLTSGVASTNLALGGAGQSVEIQNAGSVVVFVRLAAVGSAATVTDYPVLPGQAKVIGRDPQNQTHFHAITASGTALVYATSGEGM